MWVEFVAGSRLALSTKTDISQFQFVQDRGPAWKPAKDAVASSLNIEIWLNHIYVKSAGYRDVTLNVCI